MKPLSRRLYAERGNASPTFKYADGRLFESSRYKIPRESLAKRRPSGRSRTKLTRAQPAGDASSFGCSPRVSGSRTRSLISTASPWFSIGAGIGFEVIADV